MLLKDLEPNQIMYCSECKMTFWCGVNECICCHKKEFLKRIGQGMKKITQLNPGDFLTAKDVQLLFPWLKLKTIYTWVELAEREPENYPSSAKIGGARVWLKQTVLDFVNRQFMKNASQA